MDKPTERQAAIDAGFDPAALERAVRYAQDHESQMDRDIGAALEQGHFGEPWPIGKTIGPVKDRAGPSGVILRAGQIVTSWGDTARVDMTFSIAKSYLALLAGIAVDDGLIPDVHAPVRDLILDAGFDSPQNRDITWHHLLQLTSEWEGTLWDKPDWIDHNRNVMGGSNDQKGVKRALHTPGSFWEYNDVRVNCASYALMQVFGRPLPEVLKERIMDPIGASDTWQWHGYENAGVEIDGRHMVSVPGGGHWGGGLWISTLDHARVGQLMLQRGAWQRQRILSESWVQACITPCPLKPQYGYFWWLNTAKGQMFPAANTSSFFALGVGTNLIWVDPENDLVVVARWMEGEAVGCFIERVLGALE